MDDLDDETKELLKNMDDPAELERLLYIDNSKGNPGKINEGFDLMHAGESIRSVVTF